MEQMRSVQELIHKHLIIDAELSKKLNFEIRAELTTKLVGDLMTALRMSKLGNLEIYDAVDDQYPGWSFVQPITTSHISGHYFEGNPSTIHFDVYSCKYFEPKSVLEILDKHLTLNSWSAVVVDRSPNAKIQNFSRFASDN